jgi:hypothetical protein
MHSVHTEVPPNRLRELLATSEHRLVDVAALCRVDQSTAWRWQSGVIPQKHLPAIAHLLGVSVPYLAGWSDQRDPNGEEVAA